MAYRKRPRSPVASALLLVSRVVSTSGQRKSPRMSSNSTAIETPATSLTPPTSPQKTSIITGTSSGKEKARPSRELISVYNFMSKISDIHAAARNPISHAEVQRCIDVIKSINISHIGLSESYVNSCSFSQCFSLCAERNFELAVFIIPAGRTLKLHNHPKMAVVSKLLQGSVRVDSYTQEGEVTPEGEVPVGARVSQTMTTSSPPWSLSVTEKNYHEFTALSNCAIFDIIFPPYHEPDRACTYYEVHESSTGSLFLKPTTAPSDGPVNMG